MTEHVGNPKRTVAAAAVIFVLASAAFAVAFYLFDGAAYLQGILGGDFFGLAGAPETEVSQPEPSSETPQPETGLTLPAGMPQEFALRIWQEQIDSQGAMERLRSGEVQRIIVDDVDFDESNSVLGVTVEFADGTAAPGQIGFRKFDDVWYAAYVSGMRDEATGGMADAVGGGGGGAPTGELPTLDEIDVGIVNSVIAEQQRSAAVTEEYATGMIEEVSIDEVVSGPGTATLKIEMNETHGTGSGDVIMISKEIEGETLWFIARFTKTTA